MTLLHLSTILYLCYAAAQQIAGEGGPAGNVKFLRLFQGPLGLFEKIPLAVVFFGDLS